LLDKALKEEVESNWKGAYETFTENEVPRNANVIDSHVVYKVKVEENDSKRMKARLCTYGNRHKMKEEVRKNSATA